MRLWTRLSAAYRDVRWYTTLLHLWDFAVGTRRDKLGQGRPSKESWAGGVTDAASQGDPSLRSQYSGQLRSREEDRDSFSAGVIREKQRTAAVMPLNTLSRSLSSMVLTERSQ
ncbi:uncharacterized protein LOC117804679 isoform X2 [Notolabrus celidotus]|uniref:uncharacterized protein LOC117804679 isoform X2 n=1 Tax=Notolabrus celidotus TaxID=1203425 RepID=UPI00148FFCD6|nr:uncharacterized protein LOC117804679 isoform X2 [Notolabrus celidotus]